VLARPVALKKLLSANDGMRRRFIREAMKLAIFDYLRPP
jgi:hypothetical protein